MTQDKPASGAVHDDCEKCQLQRLAAQYSPHDNQRERGSTNAPTHEGTEHPPMPGVLGPRLPHPSPDVAGSAPLLVSEHGTTVVHRLARVLMAYFWEPGQPVTAEDWEKDAREVASLLERVGLTLVNRPDHWPAVATDLTHPARDLAWRLK